MPFHDLGICIQGETATDFAAFFVHLWNNAKLDKYGRANKTVEPSITTRSNFRTIVQKVFPKTWQQ